MSSSDFDIFLLQVDAEFSCAETKAAKCGAIGRLLAEMPKHRPSSERLVSTSSCWLRLLCKAATYLNRLKMHDEAQHLLEKHIEPLSGRASGSYESQQQYLYALNGQGRNQEAKDHAEYLWTIHPSMKNVPSIVCEYYAAYNGLGHHGFVISDMRPLVQPDGMLAGHERSQTTFRVALEKESNRLVRSGQEAKGYEPLNEIMRHSIPLIAPTALLGTHFLSVQAITKMGMKLHRYNDVADFLGPLVAPGAEFSKSIVIQRFYFESMYEVGRKAELVKHMAPLVQEGGFFRKSVVPHDYYTNSLMDLHRSEGAVRHLRPLVQKGGLLASNSVMQIRYAKALLLCKEPALAVAHFKPLVQVGSALYERTPIHYMYAKALIAAGKPNDAVAHCGPLMRHGGLLAGNEYSLRIMVEALSAAGREKEIPLVVKAQEKRHPWLKEIKYHTETLRNFVGPVSRDNVLPARQLASCAMS